MPWPVVMYCLTTTLFLFCDTVVTNLDAPGTSYQSITQHTSFTVHTLGNIEYIQSTKCRSNADNVITNADQIQLFDDFLNIYTKDGKVAEGQLHPRLV